MKRFTFSLQYLLDAHASKEQAAEQALQHAIRRQMDAEDALSVAEAVRARQTRAIEQLTGVVKRSDLAAHMRSIEGSDQHIARLKGCLKRCEADVRECRSTLQREMTARRTFEKMCEREQESWSEEVLYAEQKQMDELAVGRWSRQEKKR
ncbi:MAG: flagellar export protein FliJ [Pontiellaceae bacterium]|nr:flagellar export protein FliJ [Pontiellaceae bacterium]